MDFTTIKSRVFIMNNKIVTCYYVVDHLAIFKVLRHVSIMQYANLIVMTYITIKKKDCKLILEY